MVHAGENNQQLADPVAGKQWIEDWGIGLHDVVVAAAVAHPDQITVFDELADDAVSTPLGDPGRGGDVA